MFNIWDSFNIETITEKIVTNPPIITIVLIEFMIDVAKISPKLFRLAFLLFQQLE